MENTSMLREWFERVDSEKTGNITATQLKSALAVGNLEFPLSVVQQMIRFNKLSRISREAEMKCDYHLVSWFCSHFSMVSHWFWGLGYLVPDDVYKGLVKIGFSLDSPSFYTVCESFDQKKNGKIRLDDFICLCIFVQSARNLFNSFDTTKQGRVTLDFNQLVYCSK
ncbi:hypothetical protein POTOM_035160 [Populus tomentosa]|uniref:EF-hand domain-containing protein n=1 Tax=Populus tomentosa TaxID=118781 RepID=A0A8X8CPS4_POPTO|nr:hypothetical protein POTOM_035160 [Populus tomentosa]